MGQIIPFIARLSASHDWSAEERARLQELGERFLAAGLQVEVVYGVSEAGDPWCVVKDEHEEVLIHVARIGGAFVIHHALDDALRQGADLPAMLSEQLAWEDDRADVVTPFPRHAQTLLALIVATAFFYETAERESAGRNDGEPSDAAHGDIAASAPAAHLAAEAGEIRLAHAEAATVDDLRPVDGAPQAAIWRAPETAWDDFAARGDHGGGVAGRGPLAAMVTAAPGLALFEVAGGPAYAQGPVMVASAPLDLTGHATMSSFSRTGETPSSSGFSLVGNSDPDHAKPPAPTSAATHWIELDVDGDGHPDIRVEVPGEAAKAEDAGHAAPAEHEAILAVGLALPHHLLA